MYSLALLAWLGLCAVQDVRNARVSNRLTLGGLTAVVLYLVLTGHTLLGASPGDAALAAALALLFGLPGYAVGRFGAGDVKLLLLVALAGTPALLLFGLIGAGIGLALWATLVPSVWPALGNSVQQALPRLAPNPSNTYPFAPFLLLAATPAILMIGAF